MLSRMPWKSYLPYRLHTSYPTYTQISRALPTAAIEIFHILPWINSLKIMHPQVTAGGGPSASYRRSTLDLLRPRVYACHRPVVAPDKPSSLLHLHRLIVQSLTTHSTHSMTIVQENTTPTSDIRKTPPIALPRARCVRHEAVPIASVQIQCTSVALLHMGRIVINYWAPTRRQWPIFQYNPFE